MRSIAMDKPEHALSAAVGIELEEPRERRCATNVVYLATRRTGHVRPYRAFARSRPCGCPGDSATIKSLNAHDCLAEKATWTGQKEVRLAADTSVANWCD
jgi:hypothetical protein